MNANTKIEAPGMPDTTIPVRKFFDIDTDLEVPAYSQANEYVPEIDPDWLDNLLKKRQESLEEV